MGRVKVKKELVVSFKGTYLRVYKSTKTKKEALKLVNGIKAESSFPFKFSITKLASWPPRREND